MLRGLFGRKDAIGGEGCADTVDLIEMRANLKWRQAAFQEICWYDGANATAVESTTAVAISRRYFDTQAAALDAFRNQSDTWKAFEAEAESTISAKTQDDYHFIIVEAALSPAPRSIITPKSGPRLC